MILANKLQKGDTIGFFSPSSAATNWAPKRYERAKLFLEGKGFELFAGNLTGKNDYYRSGSIKDRVAELNELIQNPEIKCIISTIGGSNSNSLLPYIDYDSLKNNPKIIIGYSDVTAILFAIYSKINLVTFYGPALVASFGELGEVVESTFNYFEEILVTRQVPHIIKNPSSWTDEYIPWEEQNEPKNMTRNELITINEGTVTGRLLVGNLNTMLGIYGSEFMPEIQKGDILVIEDSLKTADVIERSFAHLKINGVFDKIGGLVLGKHEKFNDCESERKPYEILMEVMGEVEFPILAEYDCAHTHPMITLPIGVKATLDASKQSLTILEHWIN